MDETDVNELKTEIIPIEAIPNQICIQQVFLQIWQMIFSYLSFEDLVACRSVCRNLQELITSFRQFTSKNCLQLRYMLSKDEEPITILKNSSLKFGALVASEELELNMSPDVSIFLNQIGETLTYLDISNLSDSFGLWDRPSQKFKIFAENLGMFKNLYHLNIGIVDSWLSIVSFNYEQVLSSSEEREHSLIYNILFGSSYDSNLLTQTSVKKHLEECGWDWECLTFIQDYDDHYDFLKETFDKTVLEVITNNLKYLNNKIRSENSDRNQLAKEIELEVIDKLDKAVCELEYFRPKRNTSVRVLSFSVEPADSSIRDYDVRTIFQFLPNVTEFIIDGGIEDVEPLAKMHPEKIVKIDNTYGPAYVDDSLKKLPNLKSVSGDFSEHYLPSYDYEYFIDLKYIIRNYSHGDYVNLTKSRKFKLFKNLKYFKFAVYISSNNYAKNCFFDHESFSLESVKEFEFITYNCKYCQKCFDNLLRGFPNLSKFKFFDHRGDIDFCSWPQMKNLKTLTLKLKEDQRILYGPQTIPRSDENHSKSVWNKLGKKFPNLRHLKLWNDQNLDVMDIIQDNMPSLKLIELPWKTNSKQEKYRKVIRNGIEIVIKYFDNHEFEYDSDDY